MCTVHEDGSAEFTLSLGVYAHKFSASPEAGGVASLSYEESNVGRGEIEVLDPPERVFRQVIQSDEMTQYLNDQNLSKVKR